MKQINPIKYTKLGKQIKEILTTKYPLPISNIKVNKAKILLPALSTLVAPIFPDPIFLTSFFKKNLVNIKPKGIDPIRYAQKDKIIISIFKF